MAYLKQDIDILVLETNNDLSVLLNQTFGEKGFHACSASDLVDIEQELDNDNFDVVVLEEGMHEMEEVTLMQYIQESFPSIPLVFIAQRKDSPAAFGATLLNVFAVLARPFRTHELGMVLLGAKAKRSFGKPSSSSDTMPFAALPTTSVTHFRQHS